MRDERVGQLLCAASWDHPTNQMRHRAEHEAKAGGQRAIKWQHSVRGDSAEQGARSFLRKETPRQSLGRTQRTQTERGQGKRVTRPRDGTECRAFEARPAVNDATKQLCVCGAIAAQTCCCLFERPLDDCCRAIVERMCKLGGRLDEFESVLLQRQRAQKRRRDRRRVYGRADIVRESGQCEFSGPRPATDCRLRLENRHLPARLSKGDGRREAVRPRANHNAVRLSHVASDL
jgi:hypothetical protein